MNGPPKRHDDVSHATFTLKRPLEDASAFSVGGKSNRSLNEHHPPFEPGLDGRLAKGSQTEAREVDKRFSVLPMYLVSSSNDPVAEHLIGMDSKPEGKELKDNRDFKSETREAKVEGRDLYAEPRLDSQLQKPEKDPRLESRGDDKDPKSERELTTNFKYEGKIGKDAYVGGGAHLSWKDPKDHHRRRYPESSFDTYESWRLSGSMLHGSEEIPKGNITNEDKDYFEAREAVGENKIDWKGEEKFREKDRKRKDEKPREWAERDKEKSERRKDPQHASTNNERREPTRLETERSGREGMDVGKDKERLKEKEKDLIKRELQDSIDKESLQTEKERVDGTVKVSEQENVASEPKRTKEFDTWKAETVRKEKKRERDQDTEGDRQEKHGRPLEKEQDDGFAGDAATEKEKEGFSYGVQQRRRMLRPRANLQSASREPRMRSRSRDNDGSQGKAESSTVVYKVGECMQELVKLWKDFELSQNDKNEVSPNGRNDEGTHSDGSILEVRIPSDCVTTTNRQVRGGQLWGTDVYTDDSDLVAVLMHTGYCRPTASPPPLAIQEFRAHIRVLPPQDCYVSTLRNNVRSRAWGAPTGCSYRVERCRILKNDGRSFELEPCLTHTSAVEPTLAPVSTERTITTRSAASNAFRLQRLVREVTIQYNLCNEPWVKYSLGTVADKGLKKQLLTSARLKKGEVLYVETHSNRYELCYIGEKHINSTLTAPFSVQEKASVSPDKHPNHHSQAQNGDRHSTRACNGGERDSLVDVFRWSRCKQPLPQKVMRTIGIPLPVEYLEVLVEAVDWEDVQWSQTGVWVLGKEYVLARVHFLSPS